MKKILLILFLTILSQAKSYAQTEILTAIDLGERISKTIVRQLSDGSPKHVIYAEGAFANYFALDDHQSAIYGKIDSRYEVNDFAILGDYIYFVGTDHGLSQGCIGWFNIESFFFDNGTYYVTAPNFGQNGSFTIKNFNKLVVFYHSGAVRIATIGDIPTLSGTSNCCLTFDCLEGTLSPWGFEIVYSTLGESFHDIIQTDSYVVTGGKYAPGFRGISLRIFDKNNLFSNPIYQTAHVYHGGSELQDGLDQIRLTSIPGDLAASVSFFDSTCHVLPHQNEYEGIDLQLYDIDATVNLPNQCTLDKLYVIRPNVPGLCGVKGVVYNTSANTLTTLIDSDSPVGHYDFAVETNLTTTGFTNPMFTRWHPFATYHSMCDDGSASSHTIAGVFTNNNTEILMGTRRCQITSHCGMIGVTNTITPAPTCSKEETFQPLYQFTGTIEFEPKMSPIRRIDARRVCDEY